MSSRKTSRYDEQNRSMKQVSILTIAEHFGINIRVGSSGLFYFENEKGASLKISKNNLFHYKGQSVDFATPLKGSTGGDAISFVIFAVYHTQGHRILDRNTAEGMREIARIFAEMSPSISHLVPNDTIQSINARRQNASTRVSPFGGATDEHAPRLAPISIEPSTRREDNAHTRSNAIVAIDDSLTLSAPLLFSYNDKIFFCQEQFLQWSKAVYGGNVRLADDIYALGRDMWGRIPTDEQKEGEATSEELAAFSELVAGKSATLGEKNSLTDTQRATWENEELPVCLATSIHLALQRNPAAIKSLIDSGDAMLSPLADNPIGKTYSDILMKEREYFAERGFANYRGEGIPPKVISTSRGITTTGCFDSGELFMDYLTKKRGLPKELAQNMFFEVDFLRCTEDDPEGKLSRVHHGIGTPTVEGNWNIIHQYKSAGENVRLKLATKQNVSILTSGGDFVTTPDFTATSKMLWVTEGQMNTPSVLAMQHKELPGTCDMLTLNSTSNLKHGLQYMKQYPFIVLCLDNDIAGQRATRKAAMELLSEGKTVFDARQQFVEGQPLQQLFIQKDEKGNDVICLKRDGKEMKFDEYWEDRLEKGFNDINDALVEKRRLHPEQFLKNTTRKENNVEISKKR